MAYDPNEARDERGRWTVGGATGIGSDIDHPNMYAVKAAAERGAWNMRPDGVREDRYERVTELAIEPKNLPANWQTFQREGSRTKTYFDPDYAHINTERVDIGGGKVYDLSTVVPNSREDDFPLQKGEGGTLYRGMSYEEYEGALKSGKFQSTGDYNIGDAQKGLTFFSTDPQQAEAYAHGFAPWPYKAVPGRPAVVVAIKDPGGNHLIERSRPTEIGIHGEVPTSAITHAYFGHPVIVQSGRVEVRQQEGRAPQTGSSASPSASLRWSDQEHEAEHASHAEASTDLKPSVQNDPHGTWAKDGESHVAPGFPKVTVKSENEVAGKMVAERAASVAKALGFPTERMTVVDTEHPFTVNEKEMHAAGIYRHNTDSIELLAHRLSTTIDNKVYPNGVAGVTAHEITHAKYQALLNDYRTDKEAMEKDADYHKDGEYVSGNPDINGGERYFDRTKAYMKPDGRLNEPYASKYPVYQKFTDAMIKGGGSWAGDDAKYGFAKTDGVSQYSREYWTDFINSKVNFDTAVHETLAEIARVKYDASLNRKAKEDEHKANVAEIRARGGVWSDNDEKEWKSYAGTVATYQRYYRGTEPIDGKKVYFATTKGMKRLSPEWSNLYDVMDWNWKRRKK